MADQAHKDLVVLVADANMKSAVDGLLSKPQSLAIRPVTSDVFVHPDRDPGCLLRCGDFLRPFVRRHSYVLVMLDLHGCGREGVKREDVESQIEESLFASGWEERAAGIAIDPELEAWVWSDSPQVASALGWARRAFELKAWLTAEGLVDAGQIKPRRPKEAMERALRAVGKARSSSAFSQLARAVSFRRCIDPAFLKFRATLMKWFPEEG